MIKVEVVCSKRQACSLGDFFFLQKFSPKIQSISAAEVEMDEEGMSIRNYKGGADRIWSLNMENSETYQDSQGGTINSHETQREKWE